MFHIPWSIVLLMVNDLTKTRNKKDADSGGESFDEITSEEEAMKYFKL